MKTKNMKNMDTWAHPLTYFSPKTDYSLTPFLNLAIVVACGTDKGREFHFGIYDFINMAMKRLIYVRKLFSKESNRGVWYHQIRFTFLLFF